MKKTIFTLIIVVVAVAAACTGTNPQETLSPQEEMQNDIAETEKAIYAADSLDLSLACEAIGKYLNYAGKFPHDSLAAEYLFKAAEIAMNAKQPHNAVNYLTRIENEYPNFDKYDKCLFLKAFIYENEIKDLTKAERYYKLFLSKFPNSELAASAQSAIMYLGLSDEDLIKLLTAQNSPS